MTHEEKIKEELNHQAYMDVLDCNGPSMSHDEYYMKCYRFWWPLGYEAQQEREWEFGNEDLCMAY